MMMINSPFSLTMVLGLILATLVLMVSAITSAELTQPEVESPIEKPLEKNWGNWTKIDIHQRPLNPHLATALKKVNSELYEKILIELLPGVKYHPAQLLGAEVRVRTPFG